MSVRFQVFAENGHVSEHRSRTAAEAAARAGSKKHRIELRVYEGGFSRDPIASFYLGKPFPHASPRPTAEHAEEHQRIALRRDVYERAQNQFRRTLTPLAGRDVAEARVRYVDALDALLDVSGTLPADLARERKELTAELQARSPARPPGPRARRRTAVLPDCRCESTASTLASHVGWIHMDDCGGRGPGIERCDACAKFGDDEEAERAHAKVCRCGLGIAR